MKKFVLPTIAFLASFLSAQAQVFTPTNLSVLRIGGTGQTLASSGNTMTIDQFTTAGSLINSTVVPDTGSNALLTGGGGSTTEGFTSLSADGKFIVLNGYNTNRGSVAAALSGTAGSNVFRGAATIDGYGNYVLQFASNVLSGTSIRGAVSDGTNNFWVNGGNTGIIYVGKNGPVATLGGSLANERCLEIFGGNLYYGTASGSIGVFKVAGLPTSGAVTPVATLLNTNTSPGQFYINTTLGIAYLPDFNAPASGGGITRFTFTSGAWVSNYTIALGTVGAYAVVADWSQSPPVLYATTSASAPNQLVTLTDTGASATFTVLATAPAGELLKGLTWSPAAVPSVSTAPVPVLVDAGQTANFSVVAAGTSPLSYQWYSNSVANPTYAAITGATNSTLSLTSTTTDQSGSMFYVVISSPYGTAQSAPVSLTVNPPGPPTNITVSPTVLTVIAGTSVIFNSSVVGGVPLTYGWTLNGTPIMDSANISGSHGPSLTIAAAYAANAGSYVVLITNSFNTGSSSASVLTVLDPDIITQPVGATNVLNAPAYVLSVSAVGTPTLTYQWLSNNIPVSGAQSSTLSVPGSSTVGQSTYSVIVSNGSGMSVTSAPAIVAFSPYLINDTFSYPNGNLFGDAGSLWTDINGTNPEIVTNGRVVVNQTNATTDAQELFSQPVNNTVVWASFIINLSTLPTNAAGVYFANFEDTNFGFYGRLFTLTSNAANLTPDISPIAYPGTYRLGIANEANDFTGSPTNGPGAVVELDMAPNIDYQVVEYYDIVNGFCGMAVNPSPSAGAQVYNPGAPNSFASGIANDSFTQNGLPMAAYGLRQRQGEGVFQMDNLEVSFDFNGPLSGYAVVTGNVTNAKANIGLLTPSFTNYSGNSNVLEVAASGVGLGYAWSKNNVALTDGGSIIGSATPALTLSSLSAANAGTYTVTITNAAGSVTSSNVVVTVNSTTTAPSFTLPGGLEPVSRTNAEGSTAVFTATAVGTGPITYAWNFNGTPTGATGSTLTLTSLSTNQAGSYSVTATGGTGLTGTSSNAILTVTGPVSTNIHFLRSLISPSTFAISDTTTLYTATGVITTSTNLTSGSTASYYLQDSTGGINLFITGDSTFRPALGDIVTATGVLSSFGDNLELDVTAGAAFQVYTDLGPGGTNPTPALLTWQVASSSPTSTVPTIEGSVVTMTNVYFTNTGTFNNTTTAYAVTNNTGEKFTVFVSAQNTNFDGQPIPAFAASVTGVLQQTSATAFSIILSRYSDIVTNVPVTIANVSGSISGTNLTLTWIAVPSAPYSVRNSTNVSGPYTNLLATGLTFGSTNGTYTTGLPTNSPNFYEISSP